jgi:putative component of membrane protein insertase Oxa1/YidC/SpoIIIJ protein YidD
VRIATCDSVGKGGITLVPKPQMPRPPLSTLRRQSPNT